MLPEWQRYTFGNSYRYNEGKLLKVQSTQVKPGHPQHALKLKAGCGFGLVGLGLDSPGRCLYVCEAISLRASASIAAEASPSNRAGISGLSAVLA